MRIKTIAAILLLCVSAHAQFTGTNRHRVSATGGGGPSCTPKTGYTNCRVLTIAQTTANLTAFPIVTQNSSGAMVLGSSVIQNANCYDVVFSSDSSGTTLIPWEIEKCIQGTGAVTAWFATNTSSSTTTLVYVHYNNASISTAQNTGSLAPSHVWDSNFLAVYHLGNGTTLNVNDVTSNAANGTNIGTTPAGTGLIDGDASLNGTSQYITLPSLTIGPLTISACVKSGTTASINSITRVTPGSGFRGAGLYAWSTGKFALYGGIDFNSSGADLQSTTNVSTSNFQCVDGTWASGTARILYINGAAENNDTGNLGTTNSSTFSIGNDNFSQYFQGGIDQVEISNVARSAAWIAAKWANVNPASTFLTVGSQH